MKMTENVGTTLKRILVVDDQPLVVEHLTTMLELNGHVVVGAPDAQEAIMHLQRQAFDLVITDLEMPGRDGLFLAKACRQLQPNAEIWMNTARQDVQTVVAAEQAGVHRLVFKLNIDKCLKEGSYIE